MRRPRRMMKNEQATGTSILRMNPQGSGCMERFKLRIDANEH